MSKLTECPKCLGTGEEVYIGTKKKFVQKKCNLCEGEGMLDTDIADDYVDLLINDEEEW